MYEIIHDKLRKKYLIALSNNFIVINAGSDNSLVKYIDNGEAKIGEM